MKAKINVPNVKGYLQAHFRYVLDEFDYLNEHIKEQWIYRIGVMDENCLINGMCPCECSVPEKQLESRPCDHNCYGFMLNEKEWEEFKEQVFVEPFFTIAKQRIEKYKLSI